MRLYCANNNTIYRSVTDAARDLNVDRTSIHKCLNGDRKSAGGYVFVKITNADPEAVHSVRSWMLYSAYNIVLDCEDAPRLYERG